MPLHVLVSLVSVFSLTVVQSSLFGCLNLGPRVSVCVGETLSHTQRASHNRTLASLCNKKPLNHPLLSGALTLRQPSPSLPLMCGDVI